MTLSLQLHEAVQQLDSSAMSEKGPSCIGEALAFRPLKDEGEDVFGNVHPLWQPIWGRGIFGGAIIAQSLIIAQQTVPPNFAVHSIHCHFLRPSLTTLPIRYQVDRLSNGRQIAARRVSALQAGKCTFTTTISFSLQAPSADKKMLQHQVSMPTEARGFGPPTQPGAPLDEALLAKTSQADRSSFFECVRFPSAHQSDRPEQKRLLHWVRMRAPVGSHTQAPTDGGLMHLASLAYLSDSYFIGTIARAHGANRFNNKNSIHRVIASSSDENGSRSLLIRAFKDLAEEEAMEISTTTSAIKEEADRINMEMMVSLDHAIYFHNQARVKADEWMLLEMETPWSGDERGLVTQRIWTSDGVLVATSFQEGLVRALQDNSGSKL